MAGSRKRETQQQTYRLAYLMGKREELYDTFQFTQGCLHILCAMACGSWICAIIHPTAYIQPAGVTPSDPFTPDSNVPHHDKGIASLIDCHFPPQTN